MAENIFRFKKFDILQSSSVMKVGTDGVLLGAITDCTNSTRILDVGTGTGLVALMLAQRCGSLIDCIDINPEAVKLASHNALLSLWKDRIKIFHSSLQEFKPDYYYDLIVSNPPYFSTDTVAPDEKRAMARHSKTLSQNDMAAHSFRLLNREGSLVVIYPAYESEGFENIAIKAGFHLKSRYYIFPRKDTAYVRVISTFSKEIHNEILLSDIIIENDIRHDYTEQYKNITKDFYLKF